MDSGGPHVRREVFSVHVSHTGAPFTKEPKFEVTHYDECSVNQNGHDAPGVLDIYVHTVHDYSVYSVLRSPLRFCGMHRDEAPCEKPTPI